MTTLYSRLELILAFSNYRDFETAFDIKNNYFHLFVPWWFVVANGHSSLGRLRI